MRAPYREAALLVAACAVGAVAGELVVRRVAPQDTRIQTPGMFVRDRATGYRLAANYTGYESNRIEYRVTVHTDALAMRVPVRAPAGDGRPRVLVLGDSFVFGQGVEAQDAWPAQLELALAARGDTVAVLNGGIPGYSTLDEAAWLSAYGLAQHPRRVVLGVFLGNDLEDNGTTAQRRLGSIAPPPVRWYTRPTRWLYEHSHLYDLLRRLAERARPARPVDGMAANVAAAIAPYHVSTSAQRRVELDGTAAAVAKFDSLTRAAGAERLVILIPDAVAVEPAREAAVRRQVPPGVALDFNYPVSIFAPLFAAHGITCVDLTPALRAEAARGTRLYYPVDRHLTPEGNRFVAGLVAGLLRKGA
jgi:lysophospholipase L1-like esterase